MKVTLRIEAVVMQEWSKFFQCSQKRFNKAIMDLYAPVNSSEIGAIFLFTKAYHLTKPALQQN